MLFFAMSVLPKAGIHADGSISPAMQFAATNCRITLALEAERSTEYK
jgi:hypothetical protein